MLVRVGWENEYDSPEHGKITEGYFEGELESITIERDGKSITIPKEKIHSVFFIKEIGERSY